MRTVSGSARRARSVKPEGGEMSIRQERALIGAVVVCVVALFTGLKAVSEDPGTCCQHNPRECEAASTCWPNGACPDESNMCYVQDATCRWVGCHPW